MLNKRRVAFITGDTTRTGSAILLVRLMGLMKASAFDSNILIRADNGPLAADFSEVANHAAIFRKGNEGPGGFARRKLFRASGLGFGKVFDNAAVVVNNTITNGILLHSLRWRYKIPIVSYVHELKAMTKIYVDKASVEHTVKYTDIFAVPSDAVADFLSNGLHVDRSKIARLDYYLPAGQPPSERRENARLIIGGCGTADWRKGTDLFVQVAVIVKRLFPSLNCQFVWKGANMNSDYLRHLKIELEQFGHPDLVTFAANESDMTSFYSGLDVFLLTSREDPYPLVVLEAARAGLPVICFENSGGTPEFVGADCGHVVPYGDTSKMAEVINLYAANRKEMRELGVNAFRKVAEKHSNGERILSQLDNILDKLLTKSS